MSEMTAVVNVLTAQVRTLMVGSRQVTLSVYRQLEWCRPELIEPFGRVNDKQDLEGYECVVGRSPDGTLCRARVRFPGFVGDVGRKPLPHEELALWEEWGHLPLIVLAGLR